MRSRRSACWSLWDWMEINRPRGLRPFMWRTGLPPARAVVAAGPSEDGVASGRRNEERRRVPPPKDVVSLPTTDMLQVLVLENEQQSFGLVVNQILDIVESTLEPQSPSTRAGVLHCCVISDRVTELLDVPAVLLGGEAFEPPEIPA